MQINYYVKCNFCDMICNLKYQAGFSKRHPIRYKCKCGVTIKGSFDERSGINFENATLIALRDSLPDFVVYSSGELLTAPPHDVTSSKDMMIGMTSFILATQYLDYEKFRKLFLKVIFYRDNHFSAINGINDLYKAQNYLTLKKVLCEKYNYVSLENEADIQKAVADVNEIQFFNREPLDLISNIFENESRVHSVELDKYIGFIGVLGKIKDWKSRINRISAQIYENIDLLIPAIGIDFYKGDKKTLLNGSMAITTTSFEDIKQIYVDLFELICDLMVLVLSLDNVILGKDFTSVKQVKGLERVKSLYDVPSMRKKANILKLLDDTAPVEKMLYPKLSSDIRNSIGHFTYDSDEVVDQAGQMIHFIDASNGENVLDVPLIQICYDIWQMYMSLGIFCKVLINIELKLLSNQNIYPTIGDKNYARESVRVRWEEDSSEVERSQLFETIKIMEKTLARNQVPKKKIYPNELCPCGSGSKYKKCCGKRR